MSLLKKLFWLCAAAFLLAAIYVQWRAGGAGDKSWLLYAAGLGLKGRTLYGDVIETNPPLVLWLYSIPSWLSLKTGIADTALLVMLAMAATGLSVFMCLRLLNHSDLPVKEHTGPLAMFLLWLLVARTDPAYFGDRDWLMLVLTLPYVLRFLPSLAQASLPRSLRMAIGFAAALGFCLKPHALILLAGLHLYQLFTRGLRIVTFVENVIIYLGMIAYVACVYRYAPGYMTTVLPMVMVTYGAFARRLDGFLYGGIALFTLVVSFCEFRRSNDSPYRRDIYYLVFVVFQVLAYALANNGWGYAYNPLMCYALLTGFWLLQEFRWLRGEAEAGYASSRHFAFGERAALLALSAHVSFNLLVVGMSLSASHEFKCEDYPRCMLNRELTQEAQNKGSFMALTPVVGDWVQISRDSGAAWDVRFNHLWMLYRFFISGQEFTLAHQDIIDYTADAIARDLQRDKPAVVFVEAGIIARETHEQLDLPVFLSSNHRFAQSWRHYGYQRRMDRCDAKKDAANDARSDAAKSLSPQPAATHPPKPKPLGCSFDVYYRKSD